MTTAIWWIRRDLRLADNEALVTALANHTAVLPVFILDKRLLESDRTSSARQQMLFCGLVSLDRELRQRGSGLVVQEGEPERVLQQLTAQHSIGHIYAGRGYSSFSMRRDQQVARQFPLQLVDGLTALPFGTVRKVDGTPYRVFSAYAKRWKEAWQSNPPQRDALPEMIPSVEQPAYDLRQLVEHLDLPPEQEFGEHEAYRLLDAFTGTGGGVFQYGQLRDYPAAEGTSRLSAYLRFGMISPADMVRAANRAIEYAPNAEGRASAERWLDEIIWREFSVDLMHHYPHTAHQNANPAFDHMEWLNTLADLDAWKQGMTGYPFVDAGMRQLAHTGWMPNRTRMVTASFLVKHLLIDWRWGERWFMQHLQDGESASNVGGWQWVAGTGVNAAPFFRIFNPIAQAKKYDPTGDYTRRWVPELAAYPNDFIHEPWLAPDAVQRESACMVGSDYPAPIVVHTLARARALDAFSRMKE